MIIQIPTLFVFFLYITGFGSLETFYLTLHGLLMTPVLNPLILIWLNKDFRYGFTDLCGLCSGTVGVGVINQPVEIPLSVLRARNRQQEC